MSFLIYNRCEISYLPWFYTRKIKDYEFPEKNTEITSEMLPVIIERLSGLIDSRAEHSLVGTGMMSQAEFIKIKMQK